MKAIFALLLVLVVALQVQADSFQANTTAKACRRSVAYSATPKGAPTTLRFISTAACRFGKPGVAASGTAIIADINVVGRPDLSIGVFHAAAILGTYTDALSGFRLILERVIEYNDIDGVPGYQPQAGGDRPCANGITFLANAGWSAFDITSSDVDESNSTYYTATSTSTTPTGFTLTAEVSTVAMSNGKVELDPSSFKFSFDIANYVYKNASCASGLAFRIFIVAAGAARTKPSTVNINTDIDLSSQDSVDVPNAAGDSVGTFFVWDKTVTDVNGSSVVLHSNLGTYDSSEGVSGLNIPAKYAASVIWFSVEGQVSTFSWDPYAMADDSIADTSATSTGSAATTGSAGTTGSATTSNTKTSSAAIVVVEMLVVVVAALALLL